MVPPPSPCPCSGKTVSSARLDDNSLSHYPIGGVNRELRSHSLETCLGRIGSRDRDVASSAPAFGRLVCLLSYTMSSATLVQIAASRVGAWKRALSNNSFCGGIATKSDDFILETGVCL